MKGKKNVLILVLFFSLFSCAEKEAEYPVIFETIDGVNVVSNPDYPRDGMKEYELIEELSIGGDVDEEDFIFHRPQNLKVATDGTIYVLDWGNSTLKRYDREGKYIDTIGGRGQGPGEFGQIIYVALGTDGAVCVLDPVNHRVAVLDEKGEYLSGFRIEEGFPNELAMDRHHNLFVSLQLREGDYVWMSIRCYNQEGDVLLDYGEFKLAQPVMKKVKTDQGIITMSTLSRVAATTVWTVDHRGYLYAGCGDRYQVSVFDLEGKVILKFGREHESLPNEYKGIAGQPDAVGVFNVFTQPWVFDEKGNLWMPVFTSDEPEDYLYDVFSPEGIYIEQVLLPHRIFQFQDGKVYSLVRDENDYIAAKRFRLEEKN